MRVIIFGETMIEEEVLRIIPTFDEITQTSNLGYVCVYPSWYSLIGFFIQNNG